MTNFKAFFCIVLFDFSFKNMGPETLHTPFTILKFWVYPTFGFWLQSVELFLIVSRKQYRVPTHSEKWESGIARSSCIHRGWCNRCHPIGEWRQWHLECHQWGVENNHTRKSDEKSRICIDIINYYELLVILKHKQGLFEAHFVWFDFRSHNLILDPNWRKLL